MPLTHLTFLSEPQLIGSPARGSVVLPHTPFPSIHPSLWRSGVSFKAAPTFRTSIIPYFPPLVAFTDILCHRCLSLNVHLASFNQYELYSLCPPCSGWTKAPVQDGFRAAPVGAVTAVTVTVGLWL